LWVGIAADELISLNLAFDLERIEQVDCLEVDVAQNDPLKALVVGNGELLERDLILLGLADGHPLIFHFAYRVAHRRFNLLRQV